MNWYQGEGNLFGVELKQQNDSRLEAREHVWFPFEKGTRSRPRVRELVWFPVEEIWCGLAQRSGNLFGFQKKILDVLWTRGE